MGSYSGDKQNQMNTDEQKRQADQYNSFIAMLQNMMAGNASKTSPAGQAQNGYSNFAQTGGFDPSTIANIPNVSGPDAAARNAIMGYGLFQKAAESPTGLMTPDQLQDIRLRQASANGATFDSLRDNLEQRNRASGNLTPGVYTASLGQMARDKAHAIQSGTLDAENSIATNENNQRMWGANSGSTAGLGLGNLDLGFGNLNYNINNANVRNQLTGAGMKQQGQEFGLSGLNGMSSDYIKALLGAMGQEGAGQTNLIGQSMNYNGKKSSWDTTWKPLMKTIGAAAATYMTGGAAAPLLAGAVGGFGGGGGNGSNLTTNYNGEEGTYYGGSPWNTLRGAGEYTSLIGGV